MKRKLLFILHLPEPVHGAALMGKIIKESDQINGSFDASYINLSTSKELKKIGKLELMKFTRTLKIQIQVLKALLSQKYDLAYMTLTASGAGFYKDLFIVAILKLFRKKIIYHFHNKGVSRNQHNQLNNFLYRFAFKNTKSILLSQHLYYDFTKYVDKKDVFFCPLGISRSTEMADHKRNEIKEGAPLRLLFLSNMMIEKGILVLLQACKMLKEKAFNFECHFVGDWVDISEDEFQEKINNYDLKSHVFAHGKKYGKEKIEFFTNADVFVFPTYYHNECFPMVLLEAMEYRLPIVSTYEGGIADIVINGETGFLVPQKDASSLAEKLGLLMKHPSLCREMGDAGRKRCEENFTLEIYENRMKAILDQAIVENEM